MKIIKIFYVICTLIVVSSNCYAQEMSVLVGFGQTNVNTDPYASLEPTPQLHYKIGISGKYNLNEYFNIKSGFLFSARNYGFDLDPAIDPSMSQIKAHLYYLDVPLNLEINLAPWFSIYGGYTLAANVTKRFKTVDGPFDFDGTITGTKSPIYLLNFGTSFYFSRFSIDLYYERFRGEIYRNGAEDFDIYGLNFNFWFLQKEQVAYEGTNRLRNK